MKAKKNKKEGTKRCWLVHRKSLKSGKVKLLGRAPSKKKALKLAIEDEIREGCTSESSSTFWCSVIVTDKFLYVIEPEPTLAEGEMILHLDEEEMTILRVLKFCV